MDFFVFVGQGWGRWRTEELILVTHCLVPHLPANHQVSQTQGLAHPKRIVPTAALKMEMEAMRQQSLRRKTLNGVEVMLKVCRDYRHFQWGCGQPGRRQRLRK